MVQSGDVLGTLQSLGGDGTNYIPVTSIAFGVDGTPGTNDMPGRITFNTTADGGNTVTERGLELRRQGRHRHNRPGTQSSIERSDQATTNDQDSMRGLEQQVGGNFLNGELVDNSGNAILGDSYTSAAEHWSTMTEPRNPESREDPPLQPAPWLT